MPSPVAASVTTRATAVLPVSDALTDVPGSTSDRDQGS